MFGELGFFFSVFGFPQWLLSCGAAFSVCRTPVFASSGINPLNSLSVGLRKRRERDILINQVVIGQRAVVLS